jgi:hypothetical protein
MTKKTEDEPVEETSEQEPQPITMNWRWYWTRAALLTVLMFILIMWLLYPTRGAVAIWWSVALAGATLGYFVVSYYFLKR